METRSAIESSTLAAVQALESLNEFTTAHSGHSNYFINEISSHMKFIAANTEHRWTIEEKTRYILSAMAGCLITALLEAQRHYPDNNSGNVVDHSDKSRRYYPETYDEVFDEAKFHKTKYKKTKEDSLELKEKILAAERMDQILYVGKQVFERKLPFPLKEFKIIFSYKMHYHLSIIDDHVNQAEVTPLPTEAEMIPILQQIKAFVKSINDPKLSEKIRIKRAFIRAINACGDNLDSNYKREFVHHIHRLQSKASNAKHMTFDEAMELAGNVETLAKKVSDNTITTDNCQEFKMATSHFRGSLNIIIHSIVITLLAITAGIAIGFAAGATGGLLSGLGIFAVSGAYGAYRLKKDYDNEPSVQLANMSERMVRATVRF